ncbi:BppU family phage baseplate upper protein [Enterococcus faecalis]|nr:BppU family phage baseplate upper protein [Enterococcus faecalis]MEB7954403.1 BppU family phage baseplate upper protein [Enterococcus faecalis]MEB7964562.1 BppU family phage baseplate upper protein [Enterococcus faecalis]
MANKVLNLDFLKDPILPPIVYGRVGDDGLQTITINITRGDEVANLTGGVLTFEGEPAGGKVKVFDSDNISSTTEGLRKGTFDYTFPSKAFSVEGTYERAYFSFQKSGKRDTTSGFKIIVQGNADIDAPEAETIITEYNRLVEKLNKAYQDALKKINSDYDVVVARIEEITIEITKLKAQISGTIANTEKRISQIAENAETSITTIGRTVTEAMNQALEELHAADFYTKDEADSRFVNKTATENGLFIRKNIEITDLNNAKEPGIYSIPATGVENKPLPNSGSLIVNKDPGGVRQLFQTERTVLIRQFGGIPSNWTDWKEVAFTTNVVNLTEPQHIGGIKEFSETPLVNGKEVALKEDTYIYKKTGLDEVEAAYKSAFGAETNILLVRKGNKVDVYIRVNIADVTKLKTAFVPIFLIPEGFKLDPSLREGFWNVALTTVQYTFPQGNYGALYEYGSKGIRFGSDRKGNHYVHGSWRTADPFPKSGSLGTGTVTILD